MKMLIFPAVESERLRKIVEAARAHVGGERRRRGGGCAGDRRSRRLFRQAHAPSAGGGGPLALGAISHRQPGALHVSGAGGPPLPAHQYARALCRRHRRPCLRLYPLLCPQFSPLHPAAAPVSLGSGGRGGRTLGLYPGTLEVSAPSTAPTGIFPIQLWGSSVWGVSAPRSPGGAWPSG